MSRRWPIGSAVVALAAVLFALNCDTTTGPEPSAGPRATNDLLGIRLLGGSTVDEPAPAEDEPEEAPAKLIWITETGPNNAGFGSDIFGLLGGVLQVTDERIVVPAGAVLEATLFTMSTVSGPVVDVDLHAFGGDLLNRLLSPVELFKKPVTLELSYANATNVTDPSRLVIVRLLDDGRYEVLPTKVDKERKVVSAELEHFSKYAMASN